MTSSLIKHSFVRGLKSLKTTAEELWSINKPQPNIRCRQHHHKLSKEHLVNGIAFQLFTQAVYSHVGREYRRCVCTRIKCNTHQSNGVVYNVCRTVKAVVKVANIIRSSSLYFFRALKAWSNQRPW